MRSSLVIIVTSLMFLVILGVALNAHADPRADHLLIADNPEIDYEGSGEDWLSATNEWWFRGGTTAIILTFRGIKPVTAGENVVVFFKLRITNHLNGDFGLDGLVDVTINPGEPTWTSTFTDLLFDNVDPTNHIYNWGTGQGSYETTGYITLGKDYIRGDSLVVKIDRHTDTKDGLPVAQECTEQPIDTSTTPPTVPTGCYDNDDAHTIHIEVKATDSSGEIAKSGQVTVWAEAPRVPALTEWGMLVLLLLLVAAGIFVIRQRRATA